MVTHARVYNRYTGNLNHYASYLYPSEKDFESLLYANLINKFVTAIYSKNKPLKDYVRSEEIELKLKLLNTPKPKLVKIKADTPEETLVIGYV